MQLLRNLVQMGGKSPKNGEGVPKRGNMIHDNQILYNNPKSSKETKLKKKIKLHRSSYKRSNHVNGTLNITLPNEGSCFGL